MCVFIKFGGDLHHKLYKKHEPAGLDQSQLYWSVLSLLFFELRFRAILICALFFTYTNL